MRRNKPRAFRLHVHYLTEPKRRVWAVQTAGQYLIARDVDVQVPVMTVFRGPESRQPKAFLRGKGVVRKQGARIVIART